MPTCPPMGLAAQCFALPATTRTRQRCQRDGGSSSHSYQVPVPVVLEQGGVYAVHFRRGVRPA
eukprot:scaffold9512_cov181-Amphora_coffeaeformis.AAC.8